MPNADTDAASEYRVYKRAIGPVAGNNPQVGLPASRPDGTKAVCLHDFWHTFAVLQRSAGVHFIQVSKRLGHASYVITLTVYADYIPEEGTDNALPEPQAAGRLPTLYPCNAFRRANRLPTPWQALATSG